MHALCKLVEKIVFSGVDGTILILPLLVLIYVIVGQAKDCIRMTREIFREEAKERIV